MEEPVTWSHQFSDSEEHAGRWQELKSLIGLGMLGLLGVIVIYIIYFFKGNSILYKGNSISSAIPKTSRVWANHEVLCKYGASFPDSNRICY